MRFVALLCGLLLSCCVIAEIRVTDDLGNELVLEKPAENIISLAPSITESLFTIGAGQKIVGVDEFSNFPDEARSIQRVSNYAAANYELILSLQPDLVFVWQSGTPSHIQQKLRQLGVPLFVIELNSLQELEGVLHRLGRLSGHEQQARQKAAEFRQRVDQLRNKFQRQSPVSVFYQIWNEPLITVNGNHLISDVVRLCGGTNVFGEAIPLVPYVGIESVIRKNPEVIIASGSTEDSPAWLDMWQQWPQITAVKNRQVYFVPPDLMQRHSLRIVEGAEQVCDYLERARNLSVFPDAG